MTEKATAPHSSTLAWKIPWMEEPVGYSPWGRWESDMTERLHFHFSLLCIGEGNGDPLQCSCLENPRDRGAWWAAVYGVTQSWTRLKWLSSSSKDFTAPASRFPNEDFSISFSLLLFSCGFSSVPVPSTDIKFCFFRVRNWLTSKHFLSLVASLKMSKSWRRNYISRSSVVWPPTAKSSYFHYLCLYTSVSKVASTSFPLFSQNGHRMLQVLQEERSGRWWVLLQECRM